MLVPKVNPKYPVRADPSDWRDNVYNFARSPLRDNVDMRNWASPVERQLHLGSCTGQATVGAYELLLNKDAPDKFTDLSRLFVYYNARLLENNVDSDIGAYVRDAIKGLKQYGVCSESYWPYNIENFARTPSVSSYEDAKKRNIKKYYRILNLDDILDALNADHPVVFSMLVYDSFESLSDQTTIVPMPAESESPIGGHAMCFVGYDLKKELVLARNSFGPDWCMNGYCWIPFEYVKSETMDSWIFDIELSI